MPIPDHLATPTTQERLKRIADVLFQVAEDWSDSVLTAQGLKEDAQWLNRLAGILNQIDSA